MGHSTAIFFIINSFLLCVYAQRTFSVDYTNHQFLKDGQPLKRVRALGFNAIEFVIPWNLHEPTQGNFDFSGQNNITQYITLAQQNDLYVLLRPGPYICAEWEHGGLPYWLLKFDGIKLRTYDSTFINFVKNYWDKLFSVIEPLLYKNGGPVLMLQDENEYGALGACDHNYTNFLADYIWSKTGNDTVVYTTNPQGDPQMQCGAVPNTVTTVDFGPNSDDAVDSAFRLTAKYSNGSPAVCSEYWINWFTKWGQTSAHPLNVNQVADNIAHMYAVNASFSIYMIHGGTNFGFMNGDEIVTSYDYGAAIAENGDITPTYLAIHSVVQNFTGWVQPPLSVPSNNPASNYGKVTLTEIGTSFLSTLTQLFETCTSSPDPSSFEVIDHPYGYVLYTTTLTTGGSVLYTPNIRDYGYVYLNNVYQGMVWRWEDYLNSQTTLKFQSTANPGDLLRIVVENRGRENFWTSTIPDLDRKGLHNGVTLDNKAIQNWHQCGINLTKEAIDSLTSRVFEPKMEAPTTAIPQGFYIGQFSVDTIQDTFFDSTGWGKGQLFINGYNIGRYWPQVGPQMTLYVPKPFLQKNNTVLLIELLGSQQNYINFVDHAIYNYTSSK